MNDLQILLLTIIMGSTALLIFYISRLFQTESEDEKENVAEEEIETERRLDNQGSKGDNKKQQGGISKRKLLAAEKHRGKEAKLPNYTHPWLMTNLKGHSDRVLDMDLSENGKYLASCGEDETVLIWTVKDFKNKDHKIIRGNVQYDHATKVRWSPDCKAYIIQKAVQNHLEVYKLTKRPEDGVMTVQLGLAFPSKHQTDVIGIGMATTGKFIMTCSDKTTLILWDIKGEVLSTLDTYHMTTYCAKVSPCGRFVATSGFTPDVKLWEVKFNRSGEFEKVHRAFELTGHTSGVYHFDFNSDSSRIATVSKDGTWKVFDTNIDFERGQDPVLLVTGRFAQSSESTTISLSADGLVVAIGHEKSVHFFSAVDATAIGRLDDVHTLPLTAVRFDASGKFILTAGDRHIRVFHNVPGFKMKVRDLKEKLRTANKKDIVQQQINEYEELLKSLGQ